ncbi:MAG: hypothetical protein K1X72_15920 [Pyrinomonadaceae bacterium]|nr:hypothetical protein [Pyrinomonadaceae bacterium]
MAVELLQTTPKDFFLKTVYTTKDGMPQNSPTSIIQTQDGYLWVATFGGLARFDGVKFTVFNTSNTPNLVNSRIVALYQDPHGILWIGSEDGDIMNYQNGVFSLIKKSEGSPIDSVITSFYLDQNNLLWISNSKELRTYNQQNKQFTTYPADKILKKRFHNPNGEDFHIDFIKSDQENNLWVGTNEGLIQFNDGNFKQITTENGLSDNHIYSIAFNSEGGIWISNSKEVGLFKNGKFSSIAKIDYEGDFSFLTVNKENHLFFASKKYLYEVIGSEIKTYDITEVGTDGIRTLFFDKQDNLWMGGNVGLLKFTERKINYFAASEDKISIGTSAITEASDKSVWVSSGPFLLHWQNGVFKTFSIPPKASYFTSLAADKNNGLWVTTFNGIYKFEDNKLIKSEIIDKGQISPIFIDREGHFWFAERSIGLFEYQNGEITKYDTQNGLANEWVSYITQDKSGAIWIGTKGGLSKFENGKFTNYTTTNGLVNENVREVFEDEEGSIWIGTYGGGISRLKDGKIVSITSANGLAEDIASRILIDDYGFFWVLGNKGVYSVSKKSLDEFADGKIKRVYCTVYDEKDGMLIAEGSGGNQPAGWKTSDGKLWFSMIKGGIIINPIKPNTVAAPVYIEESFLNKEKVNINEKLIIQPGQENLEISYTAVSFIKPEQIQFRYKLEGFDQDWQDVGTRRIAYYPYLPPGNYTFKVIATNGNDIWSEDKANLQIEVRAPFWRSWWFLSLCILALVLMIVLGYQWRLAALKHRRLLQEQFLRQLINANETERHRIAAELHDSLGQNLLVIRNWTLLLLKQIPVKSKYRKQLEEISSITAQSLEETRSITKNLRPQHLQRFGLTETLKSLVKQIEESSKLNFDTEIEDIDNLFSGENELSVYRIVQEALTNVIKHSKAENVQVKISKSLGNLDFTNPQDKLIIKIVDDGVGFNPKVNTNGNFGLDNIHHRVQFLNGKLTINSIIGKGTTISIYLNIQSKSNEK